MNRLCFYCIDCCSPVNLLPVSRTPFCKNISRGLLLNKEKVNCLLKKIDYEKLNNEEEKGLDYLLRPVSKGKLFWLLKKLCTEGLDFISKNLFLLEKIFKQNVHRSIINTLGAGLSPVCTSNLTQFGLDHVNVKTWGPKKCS